MVVLPLKKFIPLEILAGRISKNSSDGQDGYQATKDYNIISKRDKSKETLWLKKK